MSVKNPTNTAFIKQWKEYVKKNSLPGGDCGSPTIRWRPRTGIHMWAQAVKKAGTIKVDAVRTAMSGQTFAALPASP